MDRLQKTLTTTLWAVVVVAMIAFVATQALRARSRAGATSVMTASSDTPTQKFEPLYDVPVFDLTDHNGQPITNKQLLGNVWIADFIFTNCAGPCPLMTLKMSELQKSVNRPDVKLVSFTVDPERDTPDVLKEYGRRYDAVDSRWSFVTGKTDAMYNVARGMKIAAQAATDDQPIIHSDRFLLIDRKGHIVGYYRNEPDDLKRLTTDATELAAK